MAKLVALKEKANSLFKDGLFREAIALYDQCLAESQPDNRLRCILYSNKAQAFLKLEDYENAVKASTDALNLNPFDPKALFRRAQAYEKLGKLQSALEDAQKLIRLESKNTAAQLLIRRVEHSVTQRIAESDSLPMRITTMFDLIQTESKNEEKLEKAINNLTALIGEVGTTAASLIWGNPHFAELFGLCEHADQKIVRAVHRLLAHTFEHHMDRCMFVLKCLTPQYFADRIFSRNPEQALETCRFLSALLDGLTQLKAYQHAKEVAAENTNKESSKVAPTIYPKFKLDPKVEAPVQEIFQHMVRAVNSYRLSAPVRDYILEMLIRFIPSEKGIGWSRRIVELEGALDRFLEVAGEAGTSALTNWRSRRSRQLEAKRRADDPNSSAIEEIRLHTSPNTRMIVACLLSRFWEDLTSDKARTHFTELCSDFILDLFSDPFLETKVEAASVIGTLFLGPYEVGSSILSRPGVLEGLFLLTQCPNMLYQTVALDTIILATHKKEQCLSLVSKAVPILQNLYKSENDGTRIRALVALCKFGAAGGSDATIKSLTEGSAASLVLACRRLLLGIEQREPTIDEVAPARQCRAEISESGELLVNDDTDSESEEENGSTMKTRLRRSCLMTGDAPLSHLKESETVRWAIEGFAYLSLNAEVKEELVADADVIRTLFQIAALGLQECGYALANVLANLTNSLPRANVEPELVELAKFAKQHIPEQHPLDSNEHVNKRRQRLVEAGLPVALYNLTTQMASGPIGGQEGLRELISRLYLSTSEFVENRGKLVQAGAAKALLNLSLKSNTDSGKDIAAQALARLAITSDPRVTFPGQRSLELVRPLLRLLSIDCDALQNFEGLLALTNLASLDDLHRHRIMAERGVPQIDHYLFQEHPMLRRAATECVANLAQYHAFVVVCGGTLPLEEKDLGAKLPYLSSSTERVKLLVLYCCEFEDLLLVRAAIGALATMSYDPGIIKRITDTSAWFETIQTLAGHDAYCIAHRAAHLLRNMVIYGERSLCEYICQSNMLEVIMALSQLPDLGTDETLSADTVSLNPGVPPARLRKMAEEDRLKTRQCATEALKKLNEYGLVQRVQQATHSQ
ncbi:Protein unc-45 A [Clonorchis sinensis]|uniref:Protein unc-45 A n=1 Tax=Clonorchis sinensis TaxID=79923 RepID=A0A8T1M1D9_CLOSI|nr:Protein unc-45 A [Clonorchis sinensis]